MLIPIYTDAHVYISIKNTYYKWFLKYNVYFLDQHIKNSLEPETFTCWFLFHQSLLRVKTYMVDILSCFPRDQWNQ